jgi:hypothetical protein
MADKSTKSRRELIDAGKDKHRHPTAETRKGQSRSRRV